MRLNISDEYAMRRCLELALNGSGCVSPNPLVGAVIINNGEIISEGYHKKYGDIHAEIDAIQNSSLSSFEGMTLVVNLEPCTHHGKQPPCVESIINKKFSRVVIGMQDPNPLVSGNGISKLKRAGIEVITGVLTEDCKWINRFFCKYITRKLPYITMKVAMSIDGCIATSSGESKWITCEESRRRTHVLRREVDGVLVGIGTVFKDDPHLTVRLCEGTQPAVIILDSNLHTPVTSNLIKLASSRRVYIAYSNSNFNREKALSDTGAILMKTTTEHITQRVNLKEILFKLAMEKNISSILIEGGARIFSSFVKNGLVDEIHIFSAPMLIGDGLRAFGDINTRELIHSKKFRFASSIPSDIDLHMLLLKN